MTIFSVKNRYVDTILSLKELPSWAEARSMSNVDVNDVLSFDNFWYLTNKLILQLTPADDEVVMGNTFASLEAADMMLETYWQTRNDVELKFDSFRLIYTSVENFTQQENKIEIDIGNSLLSILRSQVRAAKMLTPFAGNSYGIAVLKIKFMAADGVIFTNNYALKITYDDVFTAAPPIFSHEEPVIINEYTTPSCTFEDLFVPELSASLVYNFYESQESNYDVVSRRDYLSKPLYDIPKYVELNWSKTPKYFPPMEAITLLAGAVSSPDIRSSTDDDAEAVRTVSSDGIMFTPEMSDAGFGFGASERSIIPLFGETIDSTTPPRRIEPEPRILEFMKTDYAGYVIEKERYNEDEQNFERVELFVITDRNKTRYLDWKVAYGEIYRYKIRSIFRFVNRNHLSIYRDSDELFDLNERMQGFERGVRTSETYYFDSKFSEIDEIEIIETKRPDPPSNMKIISNSVRRNIFLTWNQKNSNKDVIGFNVYKKTVGTPFRKLNSDLLDIRHNYFIDASVDFDVNYIYAIEAVDVHNNFSYLSAQYEARIILQNLEIGRCEIEPVMIKSPGEEIFGEAEVLNEDRQDNIIFFNRNFKVVVNPLFNNLDVENPFILKIKSIDTGQKKEIKLNFTIRNIYHRVGLIR